MARAIMRSRAKEAGTCSNKRPYYLEPIERAVTAGLRERLGNRDAIALYIKTYNEKRERLAADTVNRRRKLETDLSRAEAARERVLEAFIDGRLDKATAYPKIDWHKTKIEELQAELDECDAQTTVRGLVEAVIVHPAKAAEKLDIEIRDHLARAR